MLVFEVSEVGFVGDIMVIFTAVSLRMVNNSAWCLATLKNIGNFVRGKFVY